MRESTKKELERHINNFVPHVKTNVVSKLKELAEKYQDAFDNGDAALANSISTEYNNVVNSQLHNDGSIKHIRDLFLNANEADLDPQEKAVRAALKKDPSYNSVFNALGQNGFDTKNLAEASNSYNAVFNPYKKMRSEGEKRFAEDKKLEEEEAAAPNGYEKTILGFRQKVRKSRYTIEKLQRAYQKAINNDDADGVARIESEYNTLAEDLAKEQAKLPTEMVKKYIDLAPDRIHLTANKIAEQLGPWEFFNRSKNPDAQKKYEKLTAPLQEAFANWEKNVKDSKNARAQKRIDDATALGNKLRSSETLTPELTKELQGGLLNLAPHEMFDIASQDLGEREKEERVHQMLAEIASQAKAKQEWEAGKAQREADKKKTELEDPTKYTAATKLTEPSTDEYTGGPKWQSDAAYKIAQRAFAESQTPYQPFAGERTAKLQPLQNIAKEKIFDAIQDKKLDALFNDSSKKISDLSNATSVDNIEKYTNPHQELVIDNLEKRAKRNLEEQLPALDSNFIAKGAYRSLGRYHARDKARERMLEDLNHQTANLMHQGYNNAQVHSAADMERQASAAQQMQNLKASEQGARIDNANLLDTIGTREQQLDQTKKNLEYEDFLKQKNYGPEQTITLNEIIRGLPVNLQKSSTTPYVATASPYTTAAGTMQAMMAANKMGKKSGGAVKRLATGGQVNKAGMTEEDYRNRMNMALQQVEGNEVNPMWGMLANMGAHVAGNTGQNNVMSAIGESVSSGLAGHKQVMEQNANRRTQAQELMKLIQESRRYEEEQAEERFLKREDLKLKKEHLDILRQKPGDKKKGTKSGISQKVRDKLVEKKIMPYITKSTQAEEKLSTISSLKDIASKDLGVTQAGSVPLPGWVSAGIDLMSGNKQRWDDRDTYEALRKQASLDMGTGRGQISDYETRTFLDSLGSLSNTPEGRKKIIEAYEASLINTEKQGDFMDVAVSDLDFSPQQAKNAWKKYVETHRVFDKNLNVNTENLASDPLEFLIENQDALKHKTLQQTQPYQVPQVAAPQAASPQARSPEEEMQLLMSSNKFKSIDPKKLQYRRGGSVNQPVIMTRKESLKQALSDKYA